MSTPQLMRSPEIGHGTPPQLSPRARSGTSPATQRSPPDARVGAVFDEREKEAEQGTTRPSPSRVEEPRGDTPSDVEASISSTSATGPVQGEDAAEANAASARPDLLPMHRRASLTSASSSPPQSARASMRETVDKIESEEASASPTAPSLPVTDTAATRLSTLTERARAPQVEALPLPLMTSTAAEAAVKRWKENKDYVKLQRDMSRLLTSLDRTPLADWAAQASLLTQLQRTVQAAKDIVGAVELPEGERFAKSLWRAMSPQTVVGVQRKALEVLQIYLEYVNPAYPMTKDLPHFLPALLELLPQATMQVKGDVLELMDRAVVRRMPPASLRSCAQGILAALLSCLEESETSPMYRRAMSLLEYIHTTLQRHHSAEHAAKLRGGQVLPAYTWLLIRDAASVRCPALNVVKSLIALSSLPSSERKAGTAVYSDGRCDSVEDVPLQPQEQRRPSPPLLPDWVGGDVPAVVSALLNSLQDTHEKTHRLALDVLLLVCPLGGVSASGDGDTTYRPTSAAATHRYEGAVGIAPAPSHTSVGPSYPPPRSSRRASLRPAAGSADVSVASVVAHTELFSFESKALLVAAAVQLLGTRHGTPSVTRRVLQWLTVDPGFESVGEHQQDGDAFELGAVDGAASVGTSSPPSDAYVRDVTSYLLAQGFHLVVRHWMASWKARLGESCGHEEAAQLEQRRLSVELCALQHTARSSYLCAAAPRLSSATSIAAALGNINSGGGGGGLGGTGAFGREGIASFAAAASSSAAGALATPLVWMRALLLLFRYRSPSSGSSPIDAVDGGVCSPTAATDSPRDAAFDGISEPGSTSPFALHLTPLVLPSLSCLLMDVPPVLAHISLDSSSGGKFDPRSGAVLNASPEEELWAAEVRALLRCLPWTEFVKLDMLNTHAVEKLVRPVLAEVSRAAANVRATHLQRHIQQYIHEAFCLAQALEPALMDATTDQPLAAQEYVSASLRWSEPVAELLGDVLDALSNTIQTQTGGFASHMVPLLVSTANGLLRLLVQRTQQLVEPMLDAILATATATGTAVVKADFFASFVRAVDSGVLRHLRDATLRVTEGLIPSCGGGTAGEESHAGGRTSVPSSLQTLPSEHSTEVQRLLTRMHHTTLRFTAFLAQLHLRCQQQAVAGVLLDSTSEDNMETQERELARQTSTWLVGLCKACTAAAGGGGGGGAPLFFSRAVRLLLDVLLRVRGSLLPSSNYHILEPSCLVSGGVADTMSFAEEFVLSPVVRCLWEGCYCGVMRGEEEPASAALTTAPCSDISATCGASLLVLIAVSPACARCLDVYILTTPISESLPRLVGLHRQLMGMRAQQRRGLPCSPAVPESAVLAALQDSGVLFLGLVTLLDSLSAGNRGGNGISENGEASTRRLACTYLAQATVQDLSSVLLPLFFSFLCPLVLPTVSVTPSGESGSHSSSGGAPPHYASPGPAFSALTLTVLLPSPQRPGGEEGALRMEDGAAHRAYRTIDAAELVKYFFSLLQLPSAQAWMRQALRCPTPNSLRVLLRGLEAQSFLVPDGRTGSGAAPAREGPSDTLFAATALLLLNLARQSLLSLQWSLVHLHDLASGGARVTSSSGSGLDTSASLHAEAAAPRHRATLLDSLACLNRMLEISQTGPRMQPHRSAVRTWQFTAAQLLPLLRLAVQADLRAAQSMLLDHITSVVLYVDDVTAASTNNANTSAPTSFECANGAVLSGGGDSGVASRHWQPHTLLRIGTAASGQAEDVLTNIGAAVHEAHIVSTPSNTSAWPGERQSGSERGAERGCTPVTDELQRAPPAVLSNRTLYAMIGEAVEHVVRVLCGAQEGEGELLVSTSWDHELDTLVRWLRFYCDVMPYLYRELVPSSEVVVDVLLSALEVTATTATSASPTAGARRRHACRYAALVRARCACYATLSFVLRFLVSVARAADVEDYEAAVKAKEAMSWIASTFAQEDPVARARASTMWSRSPVLAPLRGALQRLVRAAATGLRPCNVTYKSVTAMSDGACADVRGVTWGYDASAEDEDVALEWTGGLRTVAQPPSAVSAQEQHEHARQLLSLLSHSAGSVLVTTFLGHWCGVHASAAALWIFETSAQRQSRLRRQRGSQHLRPCPEKEWKGEVLQLGEKETRYAAWAAKAEAQQAASALLENAGVTLSEVAMHLRPLLREAIPKQQRAEQQPLKPDGGVSATSSPLSLAPSHVTQVLYFLDQLVEGICVSRPGGLTEQEAEVLLALAAEVVSQGPPDTLSACCLVHLLYCVIAYAPDETRSGEAEKGSGSSGGGRRGASSPAKGLAAVSRVYQSKDYAFTLCRLLEGLSLHPAAAQRCATLMLLQLLCHTFYVLLPSSLSWMDNPGRLVDAATRFFQRTLLPTLRRGIASESEAEIVSAAPLVNACLWVLRAAISGFAPDHTFEKRVQRDIVVLFFSEHFFRYSRGSLHEWTLLLRQLAAMDSEFHAMVCERLVPTSGRLTSLMMSRETEALLRERSLKSLAFYTYAVMSTEEPTGGSGGVAAASVAAAAVRHKELIHLLREQLTLTLQHFSPTKTPTVAEIDRKEVFLQPLRAALVVFRVLLLCGARESLVASLWPLVLPELLQALTIASPKVGGSAEAQPAVRAETLQEVLRLQVEALKVLDVDYTLYPSHAFSLRWLFTDDAALSNLVALQQQQRYCRSRAMKKRVPHAASPLSVLMRSAAVRCVPLVSHMEVLQLLRQSQPVASELHLNSSALTNAVHEPRVAPQRGDFSEGLAPVLSTIQRCWPTSSRPSAADDGLRRPLYNLPSTHYPRLEGVHRAAQAFTLFLQRVNGDALSAAATASCEMEEAQRLVAARRDLGQCVGFHDGVDVAYMQDLVEADLTTTDPDASS